MARRRGSRRRRRFSGLGSVISVRRSGGLGRRHRRRSRRGFGALGMNGKQILPLVIGGGAALAAVAGIRHFVKPTDPSKKFEKALFKYAPFAGMLAGALGTGLVYVATKKSIGRAGLMAGVGAAVLTGGTAFVMDSLLMANPTTPANLAGFGAVIPEYAGMAGLNGIVMEPQASRGYGAGVLGSYGEDVSLGAINQDAFGTAGFNI